MLVGVILAWFNVVNPYGKEPARLWLATVVTALSVAPMLLWMRNPRRGRLPVFQLHCLFYTVCFGLAGFFDDVSTLKSPVEEAYMRAAQWAALLGLVGLFAGFLVAGRLLGGRLNSRRSLIPLVPADFGWVALALYPVIVAITVRTRILELSYMFQIFQSLVEFLFLFLTTGFVTGALRGTSRLLYLGLYLPLALLLGLVDSHIAGFVQTAILVCILYMAFRRRVPWSPVALVAACFVVLQPVKGSYRELTWGEGVKYGVVEGTRIFFELGLEELSGQRREGLTVGRSSAEMTLARVNHLHVTGAVIRDTPSVEPFQNGRSYLPLLTKWIPRVVWHGKPEERLGNEWARRYGYLASEDDATSFNLPWLTEMFMNFGWSGVFGISLALGVVFRVLHFLYLDRPLGLAEAAFGLAISMNLMFVESNMSLMLGRWLISLISLTAFGAVVAFVRGESPSRPAPVGPEGRGPMPARGGNSRKSNGQ